MVKFKSALGGKKEGVEAMCKIALKMQCKSIALHQACKQHYPIVHNTCQGI